MCRRDGANWTSRGEYDSNGWNDMNVWRGKRRARSAAVGGRGPPGPGPACALSADGAAFEPAASESKIRVSTPARRVSGEGNLSTSGRRPESGPGKAARGCLASVATVHITVLLS